MMLLEDLGLIGNCQISALIERTGRVVWCCLPRFDSEPVFGRLLDPAGGQFSIEPVGGQIGRQRYLENTNVLETIFEAPDGRARILDFAPRFVQHDRMFRPTQLVRIVEALEGTPMMQVKCEPVLGWSKQRANVLRGSNHVHFEGYSSPLRLTSDIAPTYINGPAFALSGSKHLILSWGAPIEEELSTLCVRFLTETVRYWQRWVKHCNIPPLYQQEVIRSALALKLHCFEDTGAIVAAMTTSIPEAPGSARHWDYRYCWLRDAYYVLGALSLLGHFEERERFIEYLLGVAASVPDLALRPLYRIDGAVDLEERILENWAGFNGEGTVRVGNAAALHQQHDVFGEMVLALTPIFMDDRFAHERSPRALDLLERLARKAVSVAGTPDAGIWEHRKAWEPQTFSSLMCWAGADRMAAIARRYGRSSASEFESAAAHIRSEVLARAWNNDLGSFASAYSGSDLDAAMLQMVPLRFLPANDTRLRQTVAAIRRDLTEGGWLFRYRANDGLGQTTVAFVICTFWLVEALTAIGAQEEAKSLMGEVHQAMSPLGLLSEDYAVYDKRMWGNYPQAYSHVGLIHAAFAASPRWSDVL